MTTIAATTALVFNLICTGTTHIGKFMGEDQVVQFNEILRVDLDRKRWCKEKCTETRPIFEVTPERIKFEQDIRSDMDDTLSFVNRENGVFGFRDRRWVGSDMFVTYTQATCKRAPFTGFPARKF